LDSRDLSHVGDRGMMCDVKENFKGLGWDSVSFCGVFF